MPMRTESRWPFCVGGCWRLWARQWSIWSTTTTGCAARSPGCFCPAAIRVREYASGDELLEAEELEIGFILLDIDMPGADGFAVHRALTERSIHMPVIMMTGAAI
jgi:CheY-like chemotaxis protein